MDFLKDNIFYVLLAVAVLIVSVPSYIVASGRVNKIRVGQKAADLVLTRLEKEVSDIARVSPEVLEKAGEYKKSFEKERAAILQNLADADRHLDGEFLVPAEGGIPDGEAYKKAYFTAYGALQKRLVEAGLVGGENSVLPGREKWGSSRPAPYAIRVTQKKYWILKALVDVLTEPECGVKSVQSIKIDLDTRNPKGENRPDGGEKFWIYPMSLDFQIDVRAFPVFLEKMSSYKDVFFYIPGNWEMARAFDETQAVYVPVVAVSLYCEVWDYISTEFERDNLKAYKKRKAQRASRDPAGASGSAGRH
ncbi:MAG: hypothetical protein J7M19_09510 [Planctomycetes bacterium]|nr:hypothetical protein [Planctomycetota bacterium]